MSTRLRSRPGSEEDASMSKRVEGDIIIKRPVEGSGSV
jgi:hypothetical protein